MVTRSIPSSLTETKGFLGFTNKKNQKTLFFKEEFTMESRYDFRTIEKKWRAEWEKNPINKEDAVKPKFYCLDMFPYPSGSGLHVGRRPSG